MNNLRSSVIIPSRPPPADFNLSFLKTRKKIIMKMSSLNLMYASEEEEFFYTSTGEYVPEGSPIGLDIEFGDHVELVLFSDIFWKPLEV